MIQCYNCFKFGHLKVFFCTGSTKCIRCSEESHELCDKSIKCRNCKDEHRSTNKKCPVYGVNKEIKLIMGYNNVSFIEAKNMLFENKINKEYDRFTNPKAWPALDLRNRFFNETIVKN